MLLTKLTHPTILNTLARMGHGSQVLIADGNFPFITHSNPAAEHVFLNLRPGFVTVTDVLESLVTAIPIEAVQVMQPGDGSEPAIYSEFRQMLPALQLQPVERFAFYDMARSNDIGLVIATGEARIYANILLTIGVCL
ncbi:MAG TPA: RbsD/FucU family protein [Aggregatilineaceae bacterium]|nr:RbsD/FucU family protein [Aggregatilineaceae bacterium]